MRQFFNRIRKKEAVKHVVMHDFQNYIDQLDYWQADGRDFRVRLASEEDFGVFINLEEDAYKGFQAWHYSDFVSDWNKNPYCMYIIVEEATTAYPVGMISGRFLARGAHISHLLVRQDYQGKGLGNRLLTLWMELVKKRRIPEVTLEVRKSNHPARMLYLKEGFTQVKEIPHYYSDNLETALYLRHRFRDHEDSK